MSRFDEPITNRRSSRKTILRALVSSPTAVIVLLALVLIDVVLVVLLAYAFVVEKAPATLGQQTASPFAESSVPAETTLPTFTYVPTEIPSPTTTAVEPSPAPTTTPLPFFEGPIVYGNSYGGRELVAYRLGNGPSARAIIGGIHGGYEWNTVDLLTQTLAYFQQHTDQIPSRVTLYLIPCANPDGYAAGTDPIIARMNGNGVDLNRNWDYNWQMTATHGTRPVSAGTAPFSEPETAALRDFLLGRRVEAAIFYHSAMGKIFSGAGRTQSATEELAVMMSKVTGYPYAPEGVPGQITTGDAIDYLSTQGIAAIEIELTNHQDIEWERNLPGILAFLDWTPGCVPAIPSATFEGECIMYTIQPGDTLSGIAESYSVDLEDLQRVNKIPDANSIRIGQSICIPIEAEDESDP